MYHQQRWTIEKIKSRLKVITPFIYIERTPLPPFRYQQLESPSIKPDLNPNIQGWDVVQPESYWGKWQTNFLLISSFAVPAYWSSEHPIALYLPLGIAGDFSHPEALAYIDKEPYAACDRHHQEIYLKKEWLDQKTHSLFLHGWTGLGESVAGDPAQKLFMGQPAIVKIQTGLREFCSLTRVALSTAESLSEDNPSRSAILNVLNEAFIALDTSYPLDSSFYQSVPKALQILRAGFQTAGSPMDVSIHASGHAHIDVAWLWTLGQTRRKSERTFFNVIRNMERFPKFHFSQSQPQLYEFVEQDQPQLFSAIQKLVAEKRWEPMGGMWVEADCNVSGAESLARQFLLGRTYFREKFGTEAETPVLWLPDVFGYAWALPQLIKQAGLKYFMTIKIGWSQYNRLPYDTFLWQGIDGTRLLTHFSTVKELGSVYASTYNAMATPQEALGTWNNFQQKELHQDLLMAYGFGDGGGGPTVEMLENLEIMENFPALPQVNNSSVKQFFENIEPLQTSKMMPVWNGELYLEYHRGTYTSQSKTKRNNRKSEFLIHDVEFLCTFASLLDDSYHYPKEEINAAWKTICLHQFHDILPGSSIGAVYAEADVAYQALKVKLMKLRDAALEILSKSITGDLILVNPTPFTRSDLVNINHTQSSGYSRDGKELFTQPISNGILLSPGVLPPYSITAIQISRGETEISSNDKNSPFVLENDLIQVVFNNSGDLQRIFDKEMQREIIPPSLFANQFQLFEDRPLTYDAWDIDIYYDDKLELAQPATSIEWVEHGPLRQSIKINRQIGGSTYAQLISITNGSKQIDFDTTINWQERFSLLKVAFPVDILSPTATFEIQWGNVQRNTHRNTSWDWARFETCAHKWVDLSERDYGVSLLNDCKYGHDIHNNVIRLTLLKGATVPDPDADLGVHEFKYSLLPHSGLWNECTQSAAYALNDPIIVFDPKEKSKNTPQTKSLSFFSVNVPNIIIETIKQAEDGDGIIVRLYESQRQRGSAIIQSFFPILSAWETNLLEENQNLCTVQNGELHLHYKPFEIKTIRIKVAR